MRKIYQSANAQHRTGKKAYHAGKHTPQTPHVQTVIVFLEIDQQLGTLEVPRGDPDVVFRSGVVELGETPIDQSELLLLVIDHDIVGLDVSVHDSLGVAEVERLRRLIAVGCVSMHDEASCWTRNDGKGTDLEQLEDVESDVKVGEFGV